MSVLLLPFPPSVNTYWRHVLLVPRGKKPSAGHIRILISEKGRAYRQQVMDAVLEQTKGRAPRIAEPINVHIWACRPDRRQRDLDNYLKAVLDACTHAAVWNDDSQLQRLTIQWCGAAAPSETDPATIYELEPGLIALEINPVPQP
jgi:crossover junction endodeoxyribonuclease RusA